MSLDNAHLVPSSEDTAIIMSLLGWNTVFLNRCHTSLVHNQKQIKDLLSAVVTKRDVATPLTLGEVFTGGPAKSLLQLTPVIYGVPNIALTSGK